MADPNIGTSQPPETAAGNLFSNIIREAMAQLKCFGDIAEEKNSRESSSETVNKSGTQTNPTSSSSLIFSTDDEEGAEESQGRNRTGRTFKEIASEVTREIREAEAREDEKPREAQEAEEPLRVPAEEENRAPQENPIREILDLTGTDEEEATASGDWRSRMEDTVNLLLAENAEQNDMQLAKLVNLVDKVISWKDRETQSSN